MRIDGPQLLTLIKAKKFTQRQLAKASSLPSSSIGALIAGVEQFGERRAAQLLSGLIALGFSAAEVRKIGLEGPKKAS